jgi:hypothetical protein
MGRSPRGDSNDADAVMKDVVRIARSELAAHLRSRGAVVGFLEWMSPEERVMTTWQSSALRPSSTRSPMLISPVCLEEGFATR